MCNELTEADIDHQNQDEMSRRDFSKLLTLGAISASFPQFALARGQLTEQRVSVPTSAGLADGLWVHPTTGKHPAILMWPDIKGLRPAFELMAKRLAASGYSVLVFNPFYRSVQGAALPAGVTFPSAEAWDILRNYRAQLTPQAVVDDASTMFQFMDQQPSVDTTRGGAAMGYCMSGSFVMRAAAALPQRIKAIASFHGGGLATEKYDSPHLTIANSTAAALHAIAENDDAKDPKMKVMLHQAYEAAGLTSEIEVYANTLHGWCPPDSRAYNEKQADRAWQRTLLMFNTALA